MHAGISSYVIVATTKCKQQIICSCYLEVLSFRSIDFCLCLSKRRNFRDFIIYKSPVLFSFDNAIPFISVCPEPEFGIQTSSHINFKLLDTIFFPCGLVFAFFVSMRMYAFSCLCGLFCSKTTTSTRLLADPTLIDTSGLQLSIGYLYWRTRAFSMFCLTYSSGVSFTNLLVRKSRILPSGIDMIVVIDGV